MRQCLKMCLRSFLLPLVVCAATLLSSCAEDKPFPVRTYPLGDRVSLGHIAYVVYETQWLPQLGDGADARIPQHRYFLVRMSAVNGASQKVTIPNFTIEDDKGHTYPELSDLAHVPQPMGYLRIVKPTESAQGHVLFDAPPGHYKLRIQDEDGERAALVDIPLSFTSASEAPDVPQVAPKAPGVQ